MDRQRSNGDLAPALIVKLILVLVFLLTAAFVSGVVIGKNGSANNDRTSSDEEGINEKLSNCIFSSDELRGKYLKLRDAAREKGLVDENDVINMKIVCSVDGQKTVEPEPVEPKPADQKNDELESVATSKETSQKEQPEPAETKPSENVQKVHETSLKEKSKPAEKPEKQVEKPVETKPAEKPSETRTPEKPKQEKNQTIEEILAEKKVPQNKEKGKKCLFSIQIFAANTKEQADAAVKKLKSLKPRIVAGEDSKGTTWYKLRTGCFDSREAAETELVNVKKSEKSAYIVSE